MSLFSQVHHVVPLMWKFVRRYYIIALAGMVSLLVLTAPSKVLSQATGPSIFFNYAPITMSLNQCKQVAYNEIANVLEIAESMQIDSVIETSENGVFGSGSGGHSAAVLCLPEDGVVVAVAAGPNQQRNAEVVNYLLQEF